MVILELFGRSLSYSNVLARWDIINKETRKSLNLGKINKASLVCIITLVLSYVSIGVGFGFVSTLAASSVISAATSSLEREASLLSTGWWSRYSKDTSKRCKWPVIPCNQAGSML
ncbi:hypothetical protein V6N13_092184 [Hibiscus sabdariffa]